MELTGNYRGRGRFRGHTKKSAPQNAGTHMTCFDKDKFTQIIIKKNEGETYESHRKRGKRIISEKGMRSTAGSRQGVLERKGLTAKRCDTLGKRMGLDGKEETGGRKA